MRGKAAAPDFADAAHSTARLDCTNTLLQMASYHRMAPGPGGVGKPVSPYCQSFLISQPVGQAVITRTQAMFTGWGYELDAIYRPWHQESACWDVPASCAQQDVL